MSVSTVNQVWCTQRVNPDRHRNEGAAMRMVEDGKGIGTAQEGLEDSAKQKRTFSPARLIPIAILVAGLVAAYQFGVLDYLSLDMLKENRDSLQAWVARNGVLAGLAFVGIYTVCIALSLPVGSYITIAGGFLFGLGMGTAYVVIGATAGATILFLAARYAFFDLLEAKAGDAIRRMEKGFQEDALSYMLVLRLVPLFPFWLVNLVPAFLGVSTRLYVLGTLFGIIPGTFVYVSIGNGLGALLDRGEDPDLGLIFEPQFLIPIIGLAVLALIPVAYRHFKADRSA